jgi:CRP-like cAMP-binding protein
LTGAGAAEAGKLAIAAPGSDTAPDRSGTEPAPPPEDPAGGCSTMFAGTARAAPSAFALGRPAQTHDPTMSVSKKLTLVASRWSDPALRARAIAGVAPFIGWPAAAVTRLAQAARVVTRQTGAPLVTRGARLHAVFLVVEGDVNIGLTAPEGRTFVATVARPGAAIFGLASLVDGEPMANDVTADEAIVALSIPMAAVRAELALAPSLWESVAREVTARARFTVGQLASVIFEPLRQRAVRLLLTLAATIGTTDGRGARHIGLSLTQERFAEMLGVTRQTVSALVRELVDSGLLRWRYGRVTLLDPVRLRLAHAAAEPGSDGFDMRVTGSAASGDRTPA